MYGVSAFDAILPPGQGSILAIGGSLPTVIVQARLLAWHGRAEVDRREDS